MTNRDRVLVALNVPRCAREVAEALRVPIKTMQTVLNRLAAQGVTRCVTPRMRQARLYGLTIVGTLMRRELMVGCDEPPMEPLPDEELVLYAWLQAGRYRRLVLRHLYRSSQEPMTPRELRAAILPLYARLSMTHVYDVLRGFHRRGVAVVDDDGWQLTPLGQRLRRIMLEVPQACGDQSAAPQSNGHGSRLPAGEDHRVELGSR